MALEIAHNRCRNSLYQAIEQLGGKVELTQLTQFENIVDLIVRAMTGPWRFFHTTEHIFDVGKSDDPIEVLAALFHDLVYVQVDQGLSLNISRYIAPFIKDVNGQLVIRQSQELPSSNLFEIVTSIFGLTPGQALPPFSGQNEFLSALIAALSLSPFISESQLAQIAACIEATIPFRPLSSSGLSPSELLYQRLVVTNNQFHLGWSDSETIEVVKRSVRVTNRDVENFAFQNSADFLDNTWNLLPETNHDLSNQNSYTVEGYRWSLQNMEGFMTALTPERVFQRFRGEPDEETYQGLLSRTRKNLEVAKLYLGTKLVSIGIIEAFSMRLGRDIPVSTMMGELPRVGTKASALEDFLPIIKNPLKLENEIETEVLEVLSKGRNKDSDYDLKNSPIATFIVESVGFGEMKKLIELARQFFAGEISDSEFLTQCNPNVVEAITFGIRRLFETRADRFKGIESEPNTSSYALPGNN